LYWGRLKDRLLDTFRGGGTAAEQAVLPQGPLGAVSSEGVLVPATSRFQEQTVARQSSGLEQFFSNLSDQTGLTILDLGGRSQANVAFITERGHRLFSVDFHNILDDTFQGDNFFSNQNQPELVHYFLREALGFQSGQFDGILAWDCLEYLAPSLLNSTIDELARILRPNGYLLALFHSDEKAEVNPVYSYRISNHKTLMLSLRGTRPPVRYFNSRGLERLFEPFYSVKFFLTRDQLREVIVRR
jgi:SAM-dependent methyltransferase